jgi:protein-arginine kinase activator protein McsA
MRSFVFTVLFSLILLCPTLVIAGDEIPYDGLKKCKGCHKSQYKSWRQTAHAKALESLEAGAKEEAKIKAGLDPEQDYTEDEDCAACHVTGFGEEGGYEIDDPSKYTAGVGCESCHGPGSEYRRLHRKAADRYEKSKESMPRQDLADAGEEFEFIGRCKSCHMNYEGSPWLGAVEPYTPFTPEVDPKYSFEFDKQVRDEEAMHEHFKLEGMFTGPPLPPFHQEFQDTAKPLSKE